MNWFNVLKEQRQVARNIQSFKPIQFDKPIKIKKPEKTCYEKLLDYCSEHGQRRDEDGFWHVFENYGSNIYVPKDKILSDEIYCYALEEFKKFMETPRKKEEIKGTVFSTKGLYIIKTVNDRSIHFSVNHPDELIISYIYVFDDEEL